jgi:hypothetical protein
MILLECLYDYYLTSLRVCLVHTHALSREADGLAIRLSSVQWF